MKLESSIFWCIVIFLGWVVILDTFSDPVEKGKRIQYLKEQNEIRKQNQIVKLTLYGEKYKVRRLILKEIPSLNWLHNNWITEYHVDRSAHQFKHILAWALDHNYSYPIKYREELKHYGIDEALVKIADK